MEISEALDKVARQSAQRRSAAWAAVPEGVLGLPLSPITPATFDLLHGTRNAFVCGLPPVMADVRNFILYHSPGFDPDAPTPRFLSRLRVNLRIERALCPLLTARRKRDAIIAERFMQAVREIREIITDTWADAPPPNDEGENQGPSVAAALHAQFADMFAREYHHWPHPLPLRHTPIKQLMQLARCSDRHHLGSKATYYDAAEARIIRDFLKNENADAIASAQREKSTL